MYLITRKNYYYKYSSVFWPIYNNVHKSQNFMTHFSIDGLLYYRGYNSRYIKNQYLYRFFTASHKIFGLRFFCCIATDNILVNIHTTCLFSDIL